MRDAEPPAARQAPDAVPPFDERIARKRFGRAAATYLDASPLEAEIGRRMLERLDVVRIAPRRILDAGSGPAREARALEKRFPHAMVVAADYALPMLGGLQSPGAARFSIASAVAMLGRRLRGAAIFGTCADIQQLPFAAGSFDLVWSNMVLHWIAEPLVALREFRRVLVPGGLLMLTLLGPDSLRELRAAAGEDRVHRFPDMHDVGDRIVSAGFAAPVIDAEQITMTYADASGLFDDLRRSGQTSTRTRVRGLGGRGDLARWQASLSRLESGERLPITWEVVYGHAWAGRPAGGESVVRVDRRGSHAK